MWLSRRYSEVAYVAAIYLLVPFIGNILLIDLAVWRIPARWLVSMWLWASLCLGFTSVANNVAGYTKKIFYNAAIVVAYCVGNFVGPLLMMEKEKPRYPTAMITNAAASLLSAVIFLYVCWRAVRENRRRRQMREGGQVPPSRHNRQELVLTDKEDLNFYVSNLNIL